MGSAFARRIRPGFWFFAFLFGSGILNRLVLFLLQVGECGGDFSGAWRAGEGVEVELREEIFGAGVLIFGEVRGS